MIPEDRLDKINRILAVLKSHLPETGGSREGINGLLSEFAALAGELEILSEELDHEQHQLEENYRLASLEISRFQAMFEGAPLSYIITDQWGMVDDVNPEAERLFAVTREQLQRKPIFRIDGTKNNALRDLANKALSSGKTLFAETTLVGRNNIRFPAGVHITAAPNPLSKGSDLHWMIRDLTTEKRAKEELRLQETSKEILSDLSRRFISSPTGEIATLYREALARIGPLVGADRCYLLSLSRDGYLISRVIEWCRYTKDAIGDYLEGTGLEGFPWLLPQLQKGDAVIIENTANLPDTAAGEIRYFRNIRARQGVVLPLMIEGNLIGVLFVEHIRSRKARAFANLPLLQTLTALFTSMEVRIRDEEELRISEEKFRTLFENFLNPIFIAGDDGRFTDANVVALDFMEESREDVAAKNLTDWIPGLANILVGAPKDKPIRPRLVETEYTTHGKTKTLLLNVVPFRVRGRTLFYGIGQDITERKQAEREIADARLFLDGILRAVPLSVIVVKADGQVAFANQSFYRAFSLKPEEVEQLPLSEIHGERFDPPDLAGHIALLFATGNQIRRFAWEYRSPEGVQRFLELDAQLIQRRAPFGSMAVLVISDVTEQMRLELAIRQSEERFRSMFHESPLPLWEEDFSEVKRFISSLRQSGISDLGNHFRENPDDLRRAVGLVRVIDVNQATLDLYEAESKEAFLGDTASVFTPDSHSVFCEEFLTLDSGKKVFESEIPTRTRSRGERVLVLRLSVAGGSEESWDRVIVSLMDITERKRMAEELQKSRDLFQYIASFTQENPSPILEVRDDGSVAFTNIAATLALRRRGLGEDPAQFFPRDMDGILEELRQGSTGFFYRTVNIGESLFGESLYLSPETKTVRLYAQEITGPRKE